MLCLTRRPYESKMASSDKARKRTKSKTQDAMFRKHQAPSTPTRQCTLAFWPKVSALGQISNGGVCSATLVLVLPLIFWPCFITSRLLFMVNHIRSHHLLHSGRILFCWCTINSAVCLLTINLQGIRYNKLNLSTADDMPLSSVSLRSPH